MVTWCVLSKSMKRNVLSDRRFPFLPFLSVSLLSPLRFIKNGINDVRALDVLSISKW